MLRKFALLVYALLEVNALVLGTMKERSENKFELILRYPRYQILLGPSRVFLLLLLPSLNKRPKGLLLLVC